MRKVPFLPWRQRHQALPCVHPDQCNPETQKESDDGRCLEGLTDITWQAAGYVDLKTSVCG